MEVTVVSRDSPLSGTGGVRARIPRLLRHHHWELALRHAGEPNVRRMGRRSRTPDLVLFNLLVPRWGLVVAPLPRRSRAQLDRGRSNPWGDQASRLEGGRRWRKPEAVHLRLAEVPRVREGPHAAAQHRRARKQISETRHRARARTLQPG